MLREDAYAVVQGAAMKVWDDIQNAMPGPHFRDYLESGMHDFPLDFGAIERCFDPREFLTRTGVLFERLEALEF
jgi:adenylosuccinate lyase